MKGVLAKAEEADFVFLADVLSSWVNFSSDSALRKELENYSAGRTSKDSLIEVFDREIRYAGSAELAYLLRYLWRRGEGGVPPSELVNDVAKKMKVKLRTGNIEAKLERLVKASVERQFLDLSEEEQRRILREEGIGPDAAEEIFARVKKHGPTVIFPMIVAVAGKQAAAKIIAGVVTGIVGRIVGKEAAKQMFAALATRFPWWAEWIGPVAWGASVAWLALDLQGPAFRKTIPAILYLGLVSLRDGPEDGEKYWTTPSEELGDEET